MPAGWETSSGTKAAFHRLLLARAIRPDRVVDYAQAFVRCVFGDDLETVAADLGLLIQQESHCKTPFLLVSKPGYDASAKIEALASSQPGYQAFAMGSEEGYQLANEAIQQAAKRGTWILLKNVHLAPSWLTQLEKRLHRLTPHPNFRLFMTAEIHPKLPVNLLRMSMLLIFEPPAGIKSSLLRSFNSVSSARASRAPTERSRLYFLLAWLHAIVFERLRYVPVGWSKSFEFSETDQQCALDAIDELIDNVAQGRSNLSPTKIPWDAIRTLIQEVIYGGRIDNEYDQRRLASFVSSLFTPACFDLNFPLARSLEESKEENKSEDVLVSIPDVTSHEQFKHWIEHELGEHHGPQLLGLPSNADLMLLANHGIHVARQLLLLQDVDNEEPMVVSTGQADDLGQPAWMVSLGQSASEWLQMLSVRLPTLPRTADSMTNPLFRCIDREINIIKRLVTTVRKNLTDVKAVLCAGEKPTSELRNLIKILGKDQIPPLWTRVCRKKISVTGWMADIVRRVEQLQRFCERDPAHMFRFSTIPSAFHLGSLFAPEAFVAATRQAVAQSRGWSLEQLTLQVSVEMPDAETPTTPDPDSFLFTGLILYGACWQDNKMALSSDELFALPPLRFKWLLQQQAVQVSSKIKFPVYQDSTRQDLLFSIELDCPDQLPPEIWSQRGVCLSVWSPIRE
eukprot:TRINITY_DN782_c0_g1_i5.p1 TRINITY_DN782_c0_g1~~TRINITY_DN782_c0_g1_i5.p1  ORF type:complete len:681 (+),score=259.78 TRINITY_DN782_c0_g1_i5:468-2510(+)